MFLGLVVGRRDLWREMGITVFNYVHLERSNINTILLGSVIAFLIGTAKRMLKAIQYVKVVLSKQEGCIDVI